MELTEKDVYGVSQVELERVDIPEGSGYMYVKTMRAKDRDAWEAGRVDKKGNWQHRRFRASLVMICACNSNGEQVFTDINKLDEMNAKAVDRLFTAAKKLNGIGEDELEELEGNSESDPQDAPSSSSPRLSAVEQ